MPKNCLACAILLLPLLAHAQGDPCVSSLPVDLSKTSAKVLVLGEVHGTNEYAALARRIVCQLVQTEPLVVLGLELPHGEQARLNTYLKSTGAPSDQQALTSSAFWNEPWQDGRRSQAMFALIEHARRMRQAGAKLAIDAFDAQSGDVPEPLTPDERLPPETRDAFMAHHIELRVMQYPMARYVALTGSVHAAKLKGAGAKWGAGEEPMALRLSRRMPVDTMGANLSGGEAWQCWERSGPSGCKAKAIEPQEAGEGFDLRIDLGQLTASPPQNPRR